MLKNVVSFYGSQFTGFSYFDEAENKTVTWKGKHHIQKVTKVTLSNER